MQFLTLFAMGVLVGTACADAGCFEQRSSKCKEAARDEDGAESDLNLDLCDYQRKRFRCLADAAAECGMKFQQPAENVAETIEKLCTKGTSLYRELNQHKKCLEKAVSETKCYKTIAESLINDENEARRKDACRQVDNAAECMAKDVARACSRLTETFFRYITRPIVTMYKGYCDEVVLKN